MDQHPTVTPPEELLVYAGDRWLAVHQFNFATNCPQGVRLQKSAMVQMMDEIHLAIVRGYILDFHSGSVAD